MPTRDHPCPTPAEDPIMPSEIASLRAQLCQAFIRTRASTLQGKIAIRQAPPPPTMFQTVDKPKCIECGRAAYVTYRRTGTDIHDPFCRVCEVKVAMPQMAVQPKLAKGLKLGRQNFSKSLAVDAG